MDDSSRGMKGWGFIEYQGQDTPWVVATTFVAGGNQKKHGRPKGNVDVESHFSYIDYIYIYIIHI